MKRYGLLIVAGLFCLNAAAQTAAQRRLAERGDVPTCTALAKEALADYRFQEAAEWLEKAQTALKRKKKSDANVEALLEKAHRGEQMLHGTDRVLIVDSIVVNKPDFLSAYKISEETGSLDSFAHFFGRAGGGTLYRTELGHRIYFGQNVASGKRKIFSCDLLADNSWSEPIELTGIGGTETSEDYPFVTSDGTTLYFASQGAEDGLGGYDLYATRIGSEASRYLRPENMGMPYNSPYNDYMYVLDEYRNLGWFASDRYQPEGKVCIYVFVPNESRVTFDFDSDDPALIRACARLRSIRNTQTDKAVLADAQGRLKEARTEKVKTVVQKDFELVIDDAHTYTNYSQFRNDEARKLCRQWVKQKKQLEQLDKALEDNRTAYAGGKKDLASVIRQQEKQLETLRTEVHQLEKRTRNAELQ